MAATVRRLLCLFGRHHRSRGQAEQTPDGFVSVCSYCGIAMRKGRDGRWTVDTGSAR